MIVLNVFDLQTKVVDELNIWMSKLSPYVRMAPSNPWTPIKYKPKRSFQVIVIYVNQLTMTKDQNKFLGKFVWTTIDIDSLFYSFMLSASFFCESALALLLLNLYCVFGCI